MARGFSVDAMAIRDEMLSWLRYRRERAKCVEAEASMLIRELGPVAYAGSRLEERQARSSDERRHWRDVALAIARKTGRRIGLDTSTRIAMEADFGESQDATVAPGPAPRKVDPIDELKLIIGGR
jgi:hypothetical protein